MTITIAQHAIPEGLLDYKLTTSELSGSSPRPLLFFIHAGVSDQSLWQPQVDYFSREGWSCLTYDIFGFGQSVAAGSWLSKWRKMRPKPAINHVGHAANLLQAKLDGHGVSKAIAIGLSVGGGIALSLAIERPALIAGVVTVAGYVHGFDAPCKPAERRLAAEIEDCMDGLDFNTAAYLSTKYWGDGPREVEGRMAPEPRAQLHRWCLDILERETLRTGGQALMSFDEWPFVPLRLSDIRVPLAIAIGTLDEYETTEALERLGKQAKGATLERFETAHMVNMEEPELFNAWLESWLDDQFVS